MALKISFIWIFFFFIMYADSHYVAEGSFVGGVADIRVYHSEVPEVYTIKLEIGAIGLAKALSGNQREVHSSKGNIKRGEYYAREYTITKWYKNIKYRKEYLFDYRRKKITKFLTKWKKGKKIYSRKETLKYFTHNDMLTLYHNILHFKKKHKSGKYTITLAGAEHYGGKVTFGLAGRREKKGVDVLTLDIRNNAFTKGKGRLLFELSKDGSVSTGKLYDVKLLGTVTLKRIR